MKLVFGIAVTFGFHSEMVKSEFPVDGSENIRFDIFMGMKTESRVSNKWNGFLVVDINLDKWLRKCVETLL